MKTKERVSEDHVDYRGRKRSESWTVNDMPSETVQSQADMADISKILQRYKQVGIVDHLNMAQAMFIDVSELTDFADVHRQNAAAEVEFMKMPSKVREIFGHDVANWLDAANDPDKRALLEEAGFIEKPKKEQQAIIATPAVVPVDEEAGTD